MRRRWILTVVMGLAALPGAGAAQLALPGAGVVGDRLRTLNLPEAPPLQDLPRALVDLRLERLQALVREHPAGIALDDRREPAVRGVLLVTGADDAGLAAARAAGFALLGRETIAGLDIDLVRLAPPGHQDLARALPRLRALIPAAEISADNLYFPSGAAPPATGAARAAGGTAHRPLLGMIDGGVAAHPALPGTIEAQGFARGAPAASAHGTAIASLLIGSGPVRGAAPGAGLLAADVYGSDPAGGNAAAIARALGWFVQRRVPVATISLVGPANALLGKAVAGAQARGMILVAAVGNDGPAAPPAFPASYPGVIAVTAVDGRDRALPEAGRALHLDYAAPGADMIAAGLRGRTGRVRGTSHAAPLVAARLARLYPAPDPARRAAALRALDGEARDLGAKGADSTYGRGLVCGACRTR